MGSQLIVYLYTGRTSSPTMAFKLIAVAAAIACAYAADPTPYAYTPAPAHYAEPAYHVTPVYHSEPVYAEPVHHVEPAYGYSPAPVVHAAPAYHEPAPYVHHAPKADHYKPPLCAKDNPKTWCLEDKEYPKYEIEAAVQYHYDGVQALYKDVLANTDKSVDRLKEIVQETYLCPSVTAYIQPLRAVNTDGKWRIVVNGVKAHYETLTQTARIEECTTAGESCPLVPACYETKCLQKSIYHRFLVYDAYDQYFPFAIETFKLPSACACYNGAYVEPPHKKKTRSLEPKVFPNNLVSSVQND